MPLLDHFHPPLSDDRNWSSFHAAWTTELMGQLNEEVLPDRCYAEAQIHLGGGIKIDVATFDTAAAESESGDGGAAVVTAVWAPPVAARIIPAVFPDEFEIRIIHSSGGPQLVGVIELISPANKDRPESRTAFAAKCLAYLQAGVGLVIVDVVSNRRANLHDLLIDLLSAPESGRFESDSGLYAVGYHPFQADAEARIEVWPVGLNIGSELPTMPLALRGLGLFPLALERSYQHARTRCRIP